MGRRLGSDPTLLWLWRRLVATAPIQPLTWEPPHVAGAAEGMTKRQKDKKKKEEGPKLEIESELQLLTYTTAQGNARSLTH